MRTLVVVVAVIFVVTVVGCSSHCREVTMLPPAVAPLTPPRVPRQDFVRDLSAPDAACVIPADCTFVRSL